MGHRLHAFSSTFRGSKGNKSRNSWHGFLTIPVYAEDDQRNRAHAQNEYKLVDPALVAVVDVEDGERKIDSETCQENGECVCN